MKSATLGIGAAVLTLAGAGSAAAQALSPLGPGAPQQATRALHVQGELLVEHDSNLAGASQLAATVGNVTPEDTIFAPRLNVDYSMPIGRQAVFLDGSIAYLFHNKNKNLDNEQISLAGGAALHAGPCGGTFTGGYSRGRNELVNSAARLAAPIPVPGAEGTVPPAVADATSTVFNIQTTKEVGAGVTCGRPSGIGVFAQAVQAWSSNTEVFSGISDYRYLQTSAGLSYQRPSLGQLMIGGNYSRNINGAPPPGQLAAHGYESSGAHVQYSRRLGGRIEAVASVGYEHAHTLSPPPVTPTTPATKDFDGMTYSGQLSFKVSSRMQTRASFHREVTPTLLTGNTFEIQTGYDVGMSYTFGSRIVAALTGGQQQSEVPNAIVPVGTPLAPTLSKSRVNELSATLSYNVSRRLMIGLGAYRERRVGDNPLFNYTNDRVALTLTSNIL
ncbi:MAG: hypothetical protein ACJ798_15200 [Phenylobacterium sp.]